MNYKVHFSLMNKTLEKEEVKSKSCRLSRTLANLLAEEDTTIKGEEEILLEGVEEGDHL